METPCVDICEMEPRSGLCIGCARTLDEIVRWAEMTPQERRAIMAVLPQRRKHPADVKD